MTVKVPPRSTKDSVLIIAQSAADIEAASQAADEFSLPWSRAPESSQTAPKIAQDDTHGDNSPIEHAYQLILAGSAATLVAQDSSHGPINISFIDGANAHRQRFGGGKNQTLGRAIGVAKRPSLRVLDATAGYGKDAFALASLGCEVILTERSPVLALMLSLAVKQALADPTTESIAQRMLVVHTDACNWLVKHRQEKPLDVIYLDPMYPQSRKSALAKKTMQALKVLVGPDKDSAKLLHAALLSGTRRVVVKRPKGAPTLSGREPDFNIKSPNTRYDVYITNHCP